MLKGFVAMRGNDRLQYLIDLLITNFGEKLELRFSHDIQT